MLMREETFVAAADGIQTIAPVPNTLRVSAPRLFYIFINPPVQVPIIA